MNKTLIAIIVVVALAVGSAVVIMTRKDKPEQTTESPPTSQSTADENTTTPENPAEIPTEASEVSIEDFAFKPAAITVKRGTTVTWTNKDSVGHTVTPDEPSDAFASSELFVQGETYSVTFDAVGTYAYHCQPHPNMTGIVTVVE